MKNERECSIIDVGADMTGMHAVAGKNTHLRTNIFLECKQLFKKKGQGGAHFHILSPPLHKHATNMEAS